MHTISSAAGKTSHNPFIPQIADIINANGIITKNPLIRDITHAGFGSLVEVKYTDRTMLIPANTQPKK